MLAALSAIQLIAEIPDTTTLRTLSKLCTPFEMPLFPPHSDLTFLLGKELARVAFEPGGIHFIWWDGGEIHAMRDFDHTDDNGTCSEFGRGNWLDPPSLLHRLIQRKVSALELHQDSLVLKFEDGQSLRFYALNDAVENVLIQLGHDLKDDYILF